MRVLILLKINVNDRNLLKNGLKWMCDPDISISFFVDTFCPCLTYVSELSAISTRQLQLTKSVKWFLVWSDVTGRKYRYWREEQLMFPDEFYI